MGFGLIPVPGDPAPRTPHGARPSAGGHAGPWAAVGERPVTSLGGRIESFPTLPGLSVTCSGPCQHVAIVVGPITALPVGCKVLRHVAFHIREARVVPLILAGFGIEEKYVVNRRPSPSLVWRVGSRRWPSLHTRRCSVVAGTTTSMRPVSTS